MTVPIPQVDPEFHELVTRSEALLASIKQKRESGNASWQEMHDLNDELSQLLDRMTSMVRMPDIDKE